MNILTKKLKSIPLPVLGLVVIIATLFFFKILFFMYRYHLPLWDESVYIGIGKFLWSFGASGIWESIRPLGLPILLGFLWKIGLGTIVFYDLLMMLFVFGNIILLFLIADHLLNKKIAFISSFMLAITAVFFFNGFKILSGIPSSFFVLLSIYFYLKGYRPLIIGIVTSMAFITRFPSGLLIIALFLVILFDNLINIKNIPKKLEKNHYLKTFKKLSQLSFGFMIPLIPYFVLNYVLNMNNSSNTFNSIVNPLILASSHQSNTFHQVIGLLNNVLYYPSNLIIQNPLIIFFVVGFILLIRKKKFFLLNLTFLLLFFYFTYIINKQIRFALVFLPFICIYSAYGIFETYNYFYGSKKILRLLSLSVLSLFILFSFYTVTENNIKSFNFFDRKEPPIVEEYYKYLSHNKISGPILTTDPVFSAYSNELFIPFYNNITDAISIYGGNIGDVNIIIYYDKFYPCIMNDCKRLKKKLFEDIYSENIPLYNQTFYGSQRYIFIKN